MEDVTLRQGRCGRAGQGLEVAEKHLNRNRTQGWHEHNPKPFPSGCQLGGVGCQSLASLLWRVREALETHDRHSNRVLKKIQLLKNHRELMKCGAWSTGRSRVTKLGGWIGTVARE